MNRKTVIILLTQNKDPECFGNFKKLCAAKGFPYHSLKMEKFPIEYRNFKIYKIVFN